MLNIKLLTIFICTFLLGACVVTGPADDGFEKDNEWVDNGRLGSGMTFNLGQKQGSNDSTVQVKQVNSVALGEKSEFESFKIWNELKASGIESKEYREFLEWLKYQEFKAAN